MSIIRTPSEAIHHEIDKIKGSRFIAYVTPSTDIEAVRSFLDDVRTGHRTANHCCFAWRLSEGRFRYSDDGEPSGTAGRPILQEIDGRDLVDVSVAVVRYFGGTRLGTGGLIRAYGGAAAAGLDLVPVLERPRVERLALRFEYTWTGAVQAVLSAFSLEPRRSSYGEKVDMELEVPVEQVESIRQALSDATHGSALFGAED